MTMRRVAMTIGSVGLLMAGTASAQTAADRAAVEAAALDYIEGLYDGDTARIARSIHPDVNKYGFLVPQGQTAYEGRGMTFEDFIRGALRQAASGRRIPASAARGVQVLDLLDQTAAVKATALWGVDYLLLAKFNGRWMVRQVLWQSRPR